MMADNLMGKSKYKQSICCVKFQDLSHFISSIQLQWQWKYVKIDSKKTRVG